jgi:hypothetical protein
MHPVSNNGCGTGFECTLCRGTDVKNLYGTTAIQVISDFGRVIYSGES